MSKLSQFIDPSIKALNGQRWVKALVVRQVIILVGVCLNITGWLWILKDHQSLHNDIYLSFGFLGVISIVLTIIEYFLIKKMLRHKR